MSDTIWRFVRGSFYNLLHSGDSFGLREWFLLLAAVVVIGFFFMRGFGSRTNY